MQCQPEIVTCSSQHIHERAAGQTAIQCSSTSPAVPLSSHIFISMNSSGCGSEPIFLKPQVFGFLGLFNRQQCSHLERRRNQNAEAKWCKRCLLFGSSDYQGYQAMLNSSSCHSRISTIWFMIRALASFKDFCFALWVWCDWSCRDLNGFLEKIIIYWSTSVVNICPAVFCPSLSFAPLYCMFSLHLG